MDNLIEVKMYYDHYEKYFGDGFFPILEKNENMLSIRISFQYKNYNWIQITQDEIHGLDMDIGNKLLDILNKEGNKEGKIIKSRYDVILYQR